MTLVYFTFLICVNRPLFKYLDRYGTVWYGDTNKTKQNNHTVYEKCVFVLVTHISDLH